MKTVWIEFVKSLLAAIVCFVSIQADQISVSNRSDKDLFGRIYYVRTGKSATSAGPVVQLLQGKSVDLKRPVRKLYSKFPPLFYDRQFVVADKKTLLRDFLLLDEYRSFPSFNIGTKHGSIFYIANDKGRVKGYDSAQWKVVKPTLDVFQKGKKKVASSVEYIDQKIRNQVVKVVQKESFAIRENPYKTTQAQVRVGNTLTPQEQAFVQKRMLLVKAALEKYLGRSLDNKYVPQVAFIFSGGGYRAMISTVGSLVGAQESGLLDAVLYTVGLSGSTWAIGAWHSLGKSLQAYKNELFPKLEKDIKKITPSDAKLIAANFLVKFTFGQPVTLVDVYGGLLANRLLADFGKDRQHVYLSNQKNSIANGTRPFPIYTAVEKQPNKVTYEWYEFTPYEVGSTWLGHYVPSWAYGRRFNNGKSLDFAAEQSMGFNFGTFGSAFAAEYNIIFKEIVDGVEGVNKKKVLEFVRKQAEETWIGEQTVGKIGKKRIKWSWASVNNFARGMSNAKTKEQKYIRLTDAGIDFNLPFPPVSGEANKRQMDVMVFFDYSAGIHKMSAIKGAEQYARKKGLKFPTINYDDLTSRAVSIFKDEKDPTVPVVVYLPLVGDPALVRQYKDKPELKELAKVIENFDPVQCADQDYCSTSNFAYTLQQSKQLSAWTEFVIRGAKNIIAQVLNNVIDVRSSQQKGVSTSSMQNKVAPKITVPKMKFPKKIKVF